MNLKVAGIVVVTLVLLGSTWFAFRREQRPDARDAQIFKLAQKVAEVEYRVQQLEENSKVAR